ncbi:MAG: hypothetical protein OI74_05790 [Gammaproteobacteria bacterium (ex Lamellibrachia satsuma)]|nr:MAG: hypothetical protein OI74_05790 [Gammaproteobacteria bacterium (ex Lamellibrachia satsuma)]RRS37624.1 MAG: hypothetical protein NV67_00260 [Gammaproteobacteria bacterium (ex Lamellibrachia satsuma)]
MFAGSATLDPAYKNQQVRRVNEGIKCRGSANCIFSDRRLADIIEAASLILFITVGYHEFQRSPSIIVHLALVCKVRSTDRDVTMNKAG